MKWIWEGGEFDKTIKYFLSPPAEQQNTALVIVLLVQTDRKH